MVRIDRSWYFDRVMIFPGINDDLGNPILLTLPNNDGFGDALRRLAEAVNLVAAIEDRLLESVLVDVRSCIPISTMI